ncbi:MAG: hypothetical protein WAM14_02505 [Candidatus Nitrosopolaris sp.]
MNKSALSLAETFQEYERSNLIDENQNNNFMKKKSPGQHLLTLVS